MSLGNLAKKEDLVVTEVDKEAKTVTVESPEDLLTTEQKDFKAKGAAEEKQRILALIFGNKELMTAEFKVLMRHTGSYLAGSMAIAYSRSFNDVIKLLLQENKNEDM